jgi:hypothetical protein
MKGFASGPSRAAAALAAAYFLLHLPFLAPSLEDIDSINFALGLRHFDVASHQPHPPGYPVFIALGRLSHAVLTTALPSLPQARAEALALAIWSAIGGAIAVLAAWALFRRIDGQTSASPLWAAALLAVAPAFWITGLRPMSDMSGLAMTLTAQALLVRGFSDRRSLVLGAIVSGVAAGFRVQTLLLTFPLLIVALAVQRGAGIVWLITRPIAALAIAGLSWLVPLLAASGGIGGYVQALGTQAGEDFAWVDMLLFNPTPRRLAYAVLETFVMPWGVLEIAAPVLAIAAFGCAVMVVRDRRRLAILVVAFAPYALFHMLLQETAHIRYAVPLLPAVAWLAATGAAFIVARQRRVPRSMALSASLAAVPLLVVAAIRTIPLGAAYGSEAHPAFRAIDEIDREIAAGGRPAALFSHYSVRRPLQARAPSGVRVVEPRRSYEWMDLIDYWVGGGREPVWFLADPKRTDLALIDPRRQRASGRSLKTEDRWSGGDRAELGGVRPAGLDWFRFDTPPGWFAAEGWSLTPETGGLAKATSMGVDHVPIDAYVLRRPGPMHAMVGVYHLGGAGDPAIAFQLAIDGVTIDEWTLEPARGPAALRFIDLPSGLPSGSGDYAHLSISARSAVPGRRTPAVAVRQFDIQSAGTLLYGFGEGWHEAEYEFTTGRRWRWTSERSVLQLRPFTGVDLTLRGEWPPSRTSDTAPTMRVTAGGLEVARLRPAKQFEWKVSIPEGVVAAANGAIAVEVDRVYLPGPAEGTGDPRHLGLKMFEVRVDTGTH